MLLAKFISVHVLTISELNTSTKLMSFISWTKSEQSTTIQRIGLGKTIVATKLNGIMKKDMWIWECLAM